jgi:glycosyltransferase involved in cell wall biosynthesis
MRLLLVGNFLSATRGTRFYCEDLAEKLSSRGHHVLTTSSYDGRAARLIDMLTTLVRRRGQYDLAVIDCYSGSSFRWAEWTTRLAVKLGKHCILMMHGGRLPDFRKTNEERFQMLLLTPDIVATPSGYLRQSFSDLRKDIVHIPNALDLEHYTWQERKVVRPRLMWLRAFHGNYQPHLAIEVLAKITDKYPDARLTMVGPDKGDGSLSACRSLAKHLGLETKIDFPGAVPKKDVPRWLQTGDIFLNTTKYESFGVAVLEAAACGLPVVSTSVGELPYMWTDNEDILLVPSGNADAMADATLRLLMEQQLVNRISLNARNKAEQFDWKAVVPQWEKLFSMVSA